METISSHCINCEKPAPGTYCQHCGQKQGINRLTWSGIFGELQRRWLGFDNNFLRTVKDLTISPHKVIQASINGVRVRYIGPVGYYFLMLTIYVLVVSFLDIDMVEFSKAVSGSFGQESSSAQDQLTNDMNVYIQSNFRIFAFLMMPFFILGFWIVFKNKGYNFLETAVLNFYGQGHPMILSILSIIVFKVTNDSLSVFAISTFAYLYLAFVAALFYKGNKIWNFIKGIIALLLGFVLIMLFAFCMSYIIGRLFPEVFTPYFAK